MSDEIQRFRCNEKTSRVITGTIRDVTRTAVPAGSLTSAQLTLVDLLTGANNTGSPRPGVINGRDAQDVLNSNDVTIDSSGVFVWSVQPEDNVIVNGRQQVERHMALFVFTWATGEFRFQVELDVNNLRLQS